MDETGHGSGRFKREDAKGYRRGGGGLVKAEEIAGVNVGCFGACTGEPSHGGLHDHQRR